MPRLTVYRILQSFTSEYLSSSGGLTTPSASAAANMRTVGCFFYPRCLKSALSLEAGVIHLTPPPGSHTFPTRADALPRSSHDPHHSTFALPLGVTTSLSVTSGEGKTF